MKSRFFEFKKPVVLYTCPSDQSRSVLTSPGKSQSRMPFFLRTIDNGLPNSRPNSHIVIHLLDCCQIVIYSHMEKYRTIIHLQPSQ